MGLNWYLAIILKQSFLINSCAVRYLPKRAAKEVVPDFARQTPYALNLPEHIFIENSK